jgi:hypothetical protein
MIRDPFYQEIVKRLNGELDPELFEQCTTDVLRRIYPGLVPIRGGSDTGMDGAIGDAEDVAYPLISTTQDDVIGNLTKNLNSYLKRGEPRRNKVVLATSKSLTARKRQNIEERANKLGFVLIDVHEQSAFADLLYRDPRWCRELLGLTGQPPALSIVPITSRPQIARLLIGRKDALDWLENTNEDLLLVGQPGSGKTFLLQTFAKQNEGLFLISDDPTQIAESIREQNPKTIIVDDAHTDTDRISRLQQLREQMVAGFRIIATCWPGKRETLFHLLQCSDSSMHELQPLTRDQIVELIKSAGIAGPTAVIRELVNQAEGRPGLATTLCHLCMRGNVRQVALGDALCTDIRITFEPLLGEEATIILAAFSLGGNKGMSMEMVATQFQLSPVNVQQIATGLAAGGVLTDVGQGRLAVRPPSLRYALVRDIFFSKATSLPCNYLVNQSSDVSETALTLIGARARGAAVPDNLLTEIINRADSNKVWLNYSGLGSNECNYVLDNHPDKLLIVAETALNLVPQKAIPLLLGSAIGDTRPLHSHPEHPLRQIEDWVKSAEPGSGQATTRRGVLLDSALSWFAQSNNANITLKAIKPAFSPAFADTEMGPGSELTVTSRSGLITQREMSIIRGFWPRIEEFFRTASIQDWSPMFDLINEWLFPMRVAESLTEETQSLMHEFAIEIATDIASVNTAHLGVLSRISRTFKDLRIELSIDLDPEFDTLFPIEGRGQDWQKAQAEQRTAANKLAEKWSSQDAEDIAKRMVRFNTEADDAQLTWPSWITFVAESIASEVKNPSTWSRAFIEAGADENLVIPFLKATASSNDQEYLELLKTCLGKPRLHGASIAVELTAPFLPEDVLSEIMSILDYRFSNWIEISCMRLEIPEDRLIALLTHPDCSISAAAATGEWEATPRGEIREPIMDFWRKAIINCLERKYQGGEIFCKDPSIAFKWLQLRMKENHILPYYGENLLNVALQVINLEQRKALLKNIGDSLWHDEVIQGIVDDELEIYRDLLQDDRLKRFHLSPLAGNPTDIWLEKALLALDAGYSPSDISQAVYGRFQSWMGSESTYWSEWAESFEPLLVHVDPRVRSVGQIGKERALAKRDQALARERLEDIYGHFD